MHFSSFHKYVRTDSAWANKYTTPESDLERGWDPNIGYFKQFSSLLITSDGFQKVDSVYPEKNDLKLLPPSKFGDDWDQEPSDKEVKNISEYLNAINIIYDSNHSLSIKIGGKIISYNKFNKSNIEKDNLILHAPKMSIMRAIKSNIFDDLLIGNFAKLIIPRNNKINFHSYLRIPSKYYDNAGVKTAYDLKQFLSFHRGSYDSNYELINNQLNKAARAFILSRMPNNISLLKKLKNFYQKL